MCVSIWDEGGDEAAPPEQESSHLVELAKVARELSLFAICFSFTTIPLAAADDGNGSCPMASVVALSATQAPRLG